MFKILRFLIPITVVFISSVLGAQENQTFDTAYVLNNKKYKTQYDYFFNGKDTIYNGKLYIHQEYKNQEDLYEYYTVDGNFKNNKADKNWKLKKGVFEPSGLGYYKDYSFSYEVDANEFMAEGEFVLAEKEGVWRLYNWQIRDSKITDTTLTAKISFIDNKAKGNFKIQIEDNVLEGCLGD